MAARANAKGRGNGRERVDRPSYPGRRARGSGIATLPLPRRRASRRPLPGPPALVVAGCATVTTIGIDPGEQFVLGGGQAGAFEVRLENPGLEPVRIAEVTLSGDTTLVAVLGPGESVTATFSPGSAALLVNRGTREAVLRGRIRGSALGMRFAPVDAERP